MAFGTSLAGKETQAGCKPLAPGIESPWPSVGTLLAHRAQDFLFVHQVERIEKPLRVLGSNQFLQTPGYYLVEAISNHIGTDDPRCLTGYSHAKLSTRMAILCYFFYLT